MSHPRSTPPTVTEVERALLAAGLPPLPCRSASYPVQGFVFGCSYRPGVRVEGNPSVDALGVLRALKRAFPWCDATEVGVRVAFVYVPHRQER